MYFLSPAYGARGLIGKRSKTICKERSSLVFTSEPTLTYLQMHATPASLPFKNP